MEAGQKTLENSLGLSKPRSLGLYNRVHGRRPLETGKDKRMAWGGHSCLYRCPRLACRSEPLVNTSRLPRCGYTLSRPVAVTGLRQGCGRLRRQGPGAQATLSCSYLLASFARWTPAHLLG